LRMGFVVSLVPKCEGPGAPGARRVFCYERILKCGWAKRNAELPSPVWMFAESGV